MIERLNLAKIRNCSFIAKSLSTAMRYFLYAIFKVKMSKNLKSASAHRSVKSHRIAKVLSDQIINYRAFLHQFFGHFVRVLLT